MSEEKIKRMPGSPMSKSLYSVVVQDPIVSCFRMFLTTRVDKEDNFVEFKGFEITKDYFESIKTYEAAIEHANEQGIDMVNMIFPWHSIVNIKNITYKVKV